MYLNINQFNFIFVYCNSVIILQIKSGLICAPFAQLPLSFKKKSFLCNFMFSTL